MIYFMLALFLLSIIVPKTPLFFFIFFIVILNGCQSTKEPNAFKIPSWVASPPQDTVNVFYGIGSGYNLKTANTAALKDISNKLGVTVTSEYQQRLQFTNQNLQKYIDDKIVLSTEETPITHYQVVKNEAVGQTVYALLKVEKKDLLNASKEKLTQKNRLANKLLKQQQTSSPLAWYSQSLQQLQSNGNSAYRLAAIIHLLDPTNEIESSLTNWHLLSKKVDESQDHLCVSLIAKNKKSADIIQIIKENLSRQQIKVTAQCDDRLLIENSEQQSMLFKKFISTNEVSLELVNNQSISIASKTITLSGQSVANYINARKAAIAQFKRMLDEQTISQLLAITP